MPEDALVSKHTPTPWSMGTKPADARGWSPYLYGGTDGREVVAKLPSGQRAEPDAALIVRAVNTHEALIAASEEILKAKDLGPDVADNESFFVTAKELRALRAALALAEGK